MATLTAPFAAERGDEPALIDDAGTTTWRQFDARVDRLVNGLRAAGLSTGDTLAVVLGNRREWFELAMACAHGGWTYVPVNWHWVGDELAYVLADAGVVGVVAEGRYAEAVEGALADERAAGVRLVVAVDAPTLATGGRSTVDYEQLLAGADAGAPAEQRLGGPMFYTSGTTGRPKGVRGSLLGNSDLPPDVMSLVAGSFKAFFPIPGRTLLCGPFYHSAQYAFSFLPLIAGSSVVMQHKYDAAGILELIDRHGVTNTHLVPTQMKRLVDLPDTVKAGFDGTSLELVLHGAAPCSPAVKRALIDWWGPRITEYYGSTEGSVVSMITSEEWLAKGGSVGRPVDAVDVIVVDADGNEAPPGQEGTLYFRSKVGMTFEYHNDPDKTAAVHLQPGVATSGDVGYLDEDGYLWLSDRRIDMIISGGVNIYPAEIEGVLQGHRDVADAAVIGVPDEEYGEQVKAVVAPAEGVAPGEGLTQRLIAHCRQHLAGYKAPRTIDYVAEIPRSAAGKIQKQPLREPYWAGHDRRI
jgi:long-chain acyl-CoA synthetase